MLPLGPVVSGKGVEHSYREKLTNDHFDFY